MQRKGAGCFVPFPFRPVDVSSRDVSSRDVSFHIYSK